MALFRICWPISIEQVQNSSFNTFLYLSLLLVIDPLLSCSLLFLLTHRTISSFFARALEVFEDCGEQIVRIYARAPPGGAGHGLRHLSEDQPKVQEKIHDPTGKR